MEIEIENMPDNYLKIINHFGINNQQRKLQEEVFELQEAITKFENAIGDINEVEEEVVDVLIILHQFMEFYEMDPFKLMAIDKRKTERTLERIESGYYKKQEEV